MTKRAGPRYAIIPADAVTDDRLIGRHDLRVLALLGRHIDKKGWCARSQGRMAEELGVARGTLQVVIGRLVDAGYVEVRHEKRRDGGQAVNRYRVVLDDAARADQLDLFATGDDDAARSSTADERRRPAAQVAPPALPTRHPLPSPDEAPPALSGRGTHKERPLQQASPCDAAAAERPRPANDDRHDLKALDAALSEAAGAAIDPTCASLWSMATPQGWLDAGCDLRFDILPTVGALGARRRGAPIRSWGYFTSAVHEARDRRLAAAQPRASPAPLHPSFDRQDGRPPAFPATGARYGQPPRNTAAARQESHLGLAEELARWTGRLPDDDV